MLRHLILRSRSVKARLVWASLTVLMFLLMPTVAFAQEVQITPNFSQSPARDTGGWTFKMAVGSIIIGVLVAVLFVVAYLRFAPQFQGGEEEADAAPARRPAPAPRPVAAETAAAPISAPARVAATPAVAGAETAAATAVATATAPMPSQTAPPAAAAPRQEGPVELDQETFDRVLQEELDKGTDRRVAEGRARSAAVRAARRKAQG